MDNLAVNMLSIEVSSYCGASCVMCVHGEYENRNKTMEFGIFKKAIDEAVPMGLEGITLGLMGDFLLDPNLIEKIKYLKSNYPSITIRAGSTMQVYNEDILQYIDVLSISNYGITKETYEKVHRGSLVFEETQSNIHRLISLPKDKRPYLHMYYLCLPENTHEMEQWKEYWEKKVDEIWIWKPHSFGGNLSGYDAVDKRGAPKNCGRQAPPFKDLGIRVDGRVSVCCFDPFVKLCIGDLKESSLSEILSNSEKLKKIQKVHKNCSFAESGLICKDCDQIYDRSEALVYSSNAERKVGTIYSSKKNYVL